MMLHQGSHQAFVTGISTEDGRIKVVLREKNGHISKLPTQRLKVQLESILAF